MDESVGITMAAMKSYANAIGLLVAVAVLAGCASTNVNQQTPMTAPGLARPNQIWVYDFVCHVLRYAGRFVTGWTGRCAKYAAYARGY